MDKKLFKGFKQVSSVQFNAAKEAGTLDGYLWFVRTTVTSEGEDEGTNDVANDEFDIYFGKKQYGHFRAGEIDGIKSAITALNGNVDDITFALESLTDLVEKNTSAITTNEEAISAIEDNFANYVAKVSYENNKIIFKNADDTPLYEVDATPFIKDGILEDVSVIVVEEIDEENNPNNLIVGEKYIKFVWNTDGDSKEDYILASEIGATYTGSDSIEINSENVISLKSASAEKVQVAEIPVGGTPLADILTAKGINTINGSNLQSVLESLFSKEDWPANTPTRNVPASASASQNQPTITFSKTIATVGETITVTASAASASGSATVSYSNFTYGYSAANDNTKDGDTPPSVTKSISRTDGNYGLTASTTAGFNSATIDAANVTASSTSATLSSTSLVVEKGTNTVKVETTTPTYSITFPASEMPAYYACSTLKKTSTDHMVTAATEDKVYSGLTASNSKSSSVTGVYPIYTNATWAIDPTKDNAGDEQSNAKTAYGKTGTTSDSVSAKLTTLTNGANTFYAFIAFGNGGFTFKLPTGWKVTKAQTKSDTKTGVFDGNQGIPTLATETITVAGTASQSYNVYEFKIDAGNVIRLEIKVG